MALLTEVALQWAYQRRLTRLLGWRYGLRFRAAMLAVRAGGNHRGSVRLHPAGLLHPIELRLNSTDPDVYAQVIRAEEYASVAIGNADVIVDCGANAGYTSAYLMSRFPRARLLAIEPFPENAALCRRNLAPYGRRATVIEAAVWWCSTRLVLDRAGGGGNEWGVRVRAACPGEHGQIEAIDLPSLGLGRIDILKVDIEGSERELFAHDTERWLPSVSNIAIELHGDDCERQFRTAMSGYRYASSRSGELTICRDIAPA